MNTITVYGGATVTLPDAEPNSGCDGCGMIDPCGVHYADCRLLEPGDIQVPVEYRGPDGNPTAAWDGDKLDAAIWYAGPCRVCEGEIYRCVACAAGAAR